MSYDVFVTRQGDKSLKILFGYRLFYNNKIKVFQTSVPKQWVIYSVGLSSVLLLKAPDV